MVAATVRRPSPGRPFALESGVVDPRARRPRRRPARALAAVGAVTAALCFAPRVGSAFGSVPASAPERGPEPVIYVVQRGDTLWSIARRLQPAGDVRPLVHRLERTNHGSRVEVGDRLIVEG